MNRTSSVTLTAVTILATLFANSPSAQADEVPPPTASATVLDQLPYSSVQERFGPGANYPAYGSIAGKAKLTIGCWTYGSSVTGPYGESTIWYRHEGGPRGWLPDAYLWTGSNDPVTAKCRGFTDPDDNHYSPEKAVAWAKAHANDANRFDQDCTWFVSQALWAGGLPKSDDWTDLSTDLSRIPKNLKKYGFPGVTPAARLADDLWLYLIQKGHAEMTLTKWDSDTVKEADLGDIIAYDYDGNGTIEHLAIVTGIAADGEPNVTQHSPAEVDTYWSWVKSKDKWLREVRPDAKVYLLQIK